MGGSGLGSCRWRFSSSVRPWKGAAGTSCRPGGSCAGGFARGGARVPRGLRGDVLDVRLAEWRPASMPGSPRAKLGARGPSWARGEGGGPASSGLPSPSVDRRGGAAFAGPVRSRRCWPSSHDRRGGKGARQGDLGVPLIRGMLVGCGAARPAGWGGNARRSVRCGRSRPGLQLSLGSRPGAAVRQHLKCC